MIYMDEDLDTLERNAWQRGDYQTATLAGALIDRTMCDRHGCDEQATTCDKHVGEIETERDEAQEELAGYRERVELCLDNLRQMIETAARVSDRAAILATIDEFDRRYGR